MGYLSLFLLFWLVACQSKPELLPATQPTMPGVHLLLDDGRNQWNESLWAEHISAAGERLPAGGYILQLVRLDDLDAGKWQLFLDLCAEQELIPIIRLATRYDLDNGWWEAPSPDLDGNYDTVTQQFADFLTNLEWHTTPRLVIAGNEPNHGDEWSGVPNPAEYARFLADVADELHRRHPDFWVLNAGFDSYSPHTNGQPFVNGLAYMDAESFMDGMVEAVPDIFTQLDGWVSHAYPMSPFSEPPWVQSFGIDYLNGAENFNHLTPPAGIYNRGINGYEWELWKLGQWGVKPLPVFITETGWQISDELPADTIVTYLDMAWHGNNNRVPEMPADGWHAWGDDLRLVTIIFFAFNGHPVEWGERTNWLEIAPDGTIIGERAMATWLKTLSPDG